MKEHLPYDKQLARMLDRGLECADQNKAVLALKRIGYYRLSAYTYPFREEASAADLAAGRKRSERFRSGTSFDDAVKLYDFDSKLRSVVLQALQEIEVGLSTKVAYVLGKRAPDGHLLTEHLDEVSCRRLGDTGEAAHDAWLERYNKLRSAAVQEEYMKHHVLRYGGDVPIWVATEFMDFGSLVKLYSLMEKRDRRTIAAQMGLAGNSADTLHRWLRALNILRNHCAHNNRIWNRSTVDVPPKFSETVAPETLHHLNLLDNDERQKIYLLLALTAHLLRAVDPDSRWPGSALPTQAKKLGNVAGMTLENTMGFPEGWSSLDLWSL